MYIRNSCLLVIFELSYIIDGLGCMDNYSRRIAGGIFECSNGSTTLDVVFVEVRNERLQGCRQGYMALQPVKVNGIDKLQRIPGKECYSMITSKIQDIEKGKLTVF